MKRTVLPIVLLVTVMLGLFIFFYFTGLGRHCEKADPAINPAKACLQCAVVKPIDPIG